MALSNGDLAIYAIRRRFGSDPRRMETALMGAELAMREIALRGEFAIDYDNESDSMADELRKAADEISLAASQVSRQPSKP